MQPKDEIIEHGQDYDGIKEYDNPLPRWFLLMFYISIVFAFLYMGYYTAKSRAISQATGHGQALAWSGARLAAQVKAAEGERGEFIVPQGADLVQFLRGPQNIARGEALFKANCVACHGEQGQGIIGPNLVDRFWIHGNSPEQLLHSIAVGYPEMGMPGWDLSLGSEKVHWLTAYVASIEGRNVANPKEPQGVEVR
jgi:cytochrome c oxidase cbb3-type subunit 3